MFWGERKTAKLSQFSKIGLEITNLLKQEEKSQVMSQTKHTCDTKLSQ